MTILIYIGITIGSLLTILWSIFTTWMILNTESRAERASMQRWFFVVSLLGIFGILTQWIMFFPAWIAWKNGSKLFNWWLDESRFDNNRLSGLAEDYEIFLNGKRPTMWVQWLWHMRNMIWNFQNSYRVLPQTIKEGNQNIELKREIYNFIWTGNLKVLDPYGIYGQFAGLKYWKNGISTWNTMNGEAISLEKSIIGRTFYFYENADQNLKDNQLNWTYTQCKYVTFFFFWKRWRTIQIGMKQKGYSRQFKYQKKKLWKSDEN